MNSEFESHHDDLNTADQIIADALLTEHARLGKGRDKELVDTILRNTVNAPTAMSSPIVPKPQSVSSSADWLKVAAIVAILVVAGGLVLNGFKTEAPNLIKSSPEDRKEDVFHVVVHSPVEQVSPTPKPIKRVVELTVSDADAVDPSQPIRGASYELEIIELADTTYQEQQTVSEFRASMDLSKLNQARKPSFTVAANDTVKTESKVIYSGDAILKHGKFTIEADSIVMGTGVDEKGIVKALNAKLVHHAGLYESVAESISFDPVSGKVLGRGISTLVNDGKQEVVTKGTIVFFNDGEVTVSEAYASPEASAVGN